MDDNKTRERALCYFRNLVYACYREARHLGGKGKHPQYEKQSHRCQIAARRERESGFFRPLLTSVETVWLPREIVQPFEDALTLTPEDLLHIFGDSAAYWDRCYGGEKWAVIVEHMVRLRDAINAKDWKWAGATCDAVRHLEHNSGKLVDPTKEYKWPVDCDKEV